MNITEIKVNKSILKIAGIVIYIFILLSPDLNPLNFITGDHLTPKFTLVSATKNENNLCEVWLQNVGRSQAFDLKYYIKNELTGDYDQSGLIVNFTIDPGKVLLISTSLVQDNIQLEKEAVLKYAWNKNGVNIYAEEKINFKIQIS